MRGYNLGRFLEAARGEHKELDDSDRGISVILINSEKGRGFFDGIKCFKQVIPYEWIPSRTYAVVCSSEKPNNRDTAFKLLKENMDFSKIVGKCTEVDSLMKIWHKAKAILKRGKMRNG